MKHLISALVCMFVIITATAQNKTANSLSYKTAIGVKVWNGAGVTLKTFLTERDALEFIGFFNTYGTRITGLYEFHGNLNTEGNLKWYVGFGGHVGLYKPNITVIGVDGVIGIDYKFANAPINLALDWQPSLELKKDYGFNSNWGGFAIRFTL